MKLFLAYCRGGRKLFPLPLPDQEASFVQFVGDRWRLLHRDLEKGKNVDWKIIEIEDHLKDGEEDLEKRRLDPEKDWRRDLDRARRLHAEHKNIALENSNALKMWLAAWQEHILTSDRITHQFAQDGIKYILAVHGATAVASLNALVSQQSHPYRTVLLTSMLCASIGILLVALGKIVLINGISARNATVRGYFLKSRSWRSLRAVSRWDSKTTNRRALRIADFFIYGSIVWFALYSFVCFMLLLCTRTVIT